MPLSQLHPTFQEPDVQINDAILKLWRHDQLSGAEELLSKAIPEAQDSTYHVLACRALVRTRLHEWEAAIVDANEVSSPLFSYTLTLTLISASPSNFDHPSWATLQRV